MPGIKKFAIYSQVRALRQMLGDRLDRGELKMDNKSWWDIWRELNNVELKLEAMNLKEEGED